VAATALGHAASSGAGSSGGRAGARRRRGSKGAEAAADLGASAVAHGKLAVHGGCGDVRRPRRALTMAARGGLPGQGGVRRGGRGGQWLWRRGVMRARKAVAMADTRGGGTAHPGGDKGVLPS
jgi:hypothetical protein